MAKATWGEWRIDQEQGRMNLPWCMCCSERMYPGEVSIGMGGHQCGWCFEHCDAIHHICARGGQPDYVPTNQIPMFPERVV